MYIEGDSNEIYYNCINHNGHGLGITGSDSYIYLNNFLYNYPNAQNSGSNGLVGKYLWAPKNRQLLSDNKDPWV